MKIYMIRHGQTEWNKLARWQGHADIVLDETGIMQAGLVSERFANIPIEHIFSSPLKRAAVTAQTINEKVHSEITYLDDLKEIALGVWEGLTVTQVRENYHDLFAQWEADPTIDIGLDVENYQQLQNRAFNMLTQISHSGYESALVVTHGAWLRALTCKLLHIPLKERLCFENSNTGINIVEYNPQRDSFWVLTLNDFSHLTINASK